LVSVSVKEVDESAAIIPYATQAPGGKTRDVPTISRQVVKMQHFLRNSTHRLVPDCCGAPAVTAS
jgi:hypothetical protein